MFDKIRWDILDMCKEYGGQIDEPLLTMLVMYIAHNITDAKQEVFDLVHNIIKGGGDNDTNG